jgi:hypothetical protein
VGREVNVVCPRCEQDYLGQFSVPKTGETGLLCPECDALWIAGVDLPFPGYTHLDEFLEERGLHWKDMVDGPSTREGPPPADVRVLRRLSSRPHKPAPNEPPWGEVGGIPCPWCEGSLLNAELPPGLRFTFCESCESLWPQGVLLTPKAPTCLADYLDDHHATWDEVSNLGRRREE